MVERYGGALDGVRRLRLLEGRVAELRERREDPGLAHEDAAVRVRREVADDREAPTFHPNFQILANNDQQSLTVAKFRFIILN